MEEAKIHLDYHRKKYNKKIDKEIIDLENNNKRLRKEFEEKWNKIDIEMDNEKMNIFDRGDDLDGNFIKRLHDQCDDKVDEENYLIMNENDSADIFFSDKMEEWMKWVDVYNNRKKLSDDRPFYKILAEDFPVPDFNTNDYEHEEMMKSSWYDEWSNSVEDVIKIEKFI